MHLVGPPHLATRIQRSVLASQVICPGARSQQTRSKKVEHGSRSSLQQKYEIKHVATYDFLAVLRAGKDSGVVAALATELLRWKAAGASGLGCLRIELGDDSVDISAVGSGEVVRVDGETLRLGRGSGIGRGGS